MSVGLCHSKAALLAILETHFLKICRCRYSTHSTLSNSAAFPCCMVCCLSAEQQHAMSPVTQHTCSGDDRVRD